MNWTYKRQTKQTCATTFPREKRTELATETSLALAAVDSITFILHGLPEPSARIMFSADKHKLIMY